MTGMTCNLEARKGTVSIVRTRRSTTDVPEPTNRVTFVVGEKNLAGYNRKVPIVVLH